MYVCMYVYMYVCRYVCVSFMRCFCCLYVLLGCCDFVLTYRPLGRLIGSFVIHVFVDPKTAPNGAPRDGIPFAVVGLQFGLTSNHFMWIWGECCGFGVNLGHAMGHRTCPWATRHAPWTRHGSRMVPKWAPRTPRRYYSLKTSVSRRRNDYLCWK